MASRHPVLKGVAIFCVTIVLFFFAVFFYAYLTGGEKGVLTVLGGEGIGVVEVDGAIEDSKVVIDNLKRFGDSDDVKGVIVRIDSPGGGVVPTQEIYAEIERLKKKKPVVASLGSVAASGGYYIASACTQIVASPGTLTGSIGVIMELGNIEELMKKIGVKGYAIKSGPHKDIGSPLQPLSPEGRAILQSVVDSVHAQFVQAVAKGRNLPEAKVRALADGRIYSGEQAKSIGLVDSLGGMEDAIQLLAKRVGLPEKPPLFYAPKDDRAWWQRLLSHFGAEWWARRPNGGLRYEWSPAFLS
ncbi:MAG TPA: signal peptide peptidase SppA [Candidatus Acidoferrales bacterium]|nr:signal peptide peptidase SppA [Candidatus Acidoferrales bacterium]